MRISKQFRFEAAHRLQNHDGKCRNLHGHSYSVEATVEGERPDRPAGDPQEGMLLDFGVLKEWWKKIEPSLDHVTILQDTDPLVAVLTPTGTQLTTFPWPPTAENLAAYLKDQLQGWLMHHTAGGMSAVVVVWETETSWAEA